MYDRRHRAITSVLHKMLSLNSTRFLTIVQTSFVYRAQLNTSHYFSLRTNTDPVPKLVFYLLFMTSKTPIDGHSTGS